LRTTGGGGRGRIAIEQDESGYHDQRNDGQDAHQEHDAPATDGFASIS
jgi:hypothetical protein